MPQNPIITFPTPAYQNVPIHDEFYAPKVFVISDISIGQTTIVTTTVDHDFVIGQWVRLIIPNKYGSRLLNEQQGLVISIPSSNSVELNIDSIGTDAFIASPVFIQFESKTLPQIIPIGDNNFGAINSSGRINTGTFIPGSFINISPL